MVPTDVAEDAGGPGAARAWGELWQMPVIVMSIALMGGALWYARQPAPLDDLTALLEQAESHIAAGRFGEAASLLENSIDPWIERATIAEQGHFHALAADSILLSLDRRRARDASLLEGGVHHAAAAAEHGAILTPDQIERWGAAEYALRREEAARERLAALDRLATDPVLGVEARQARSRLLRRMIARAAADGDADPESALDLVKDYRDDPELPVSDRIWAAARQAELFLETGAASDAVAQLMVDLRLLESHLPEGGDLGELLSLLARGYLELGQIAFAGEQCDRALAMIGKHDPRRGSALVARGWILAGQSRFEEAWETFAAALAEFPGAPSHPAALLGLAELHAELGDHAACQREYLALAEHLRRGASESRITARRVVTMLAERRHDRALASGDLDLALAYLELASQILPVEQLPEPVLNRIGTTHRSVAERGLAGASDSVALAPTSTNHFRSAADAFAALASSLEGRPERDEAWLQALWQAGDNDDMAGRYDRAIANFAEVLSRRSFNDSRGLEAAWRAARCHLAAMRPREAAELFTRILEQHPHHPIAAASHVPLARCFVLLALPDRAEAVLLRVVRGATALEPAAVDFREAQVALAELYSGEGRYREAIEQFTMALARYPDDPRALAWRSRLAESYLSNARLIAEDAATSALPGTEATAARALRKEHLREAMTLFGQVAAECANAPEVARDAFATEQQVRAMIAQAECAVELGDFPQAIDLFERASTRFPEHPATLLAMVEIVNCHQALGDDRAAERAHAHALAQLERLAAAGVEFDSSVLDERAWRRWLAEWPAGATAPRE